MSRPAGLSGTARDRVLRICAAGGDARTLRLRLLDELRQTIGYDAYAWLVTDPETSVGVVPLADVPCLPELPRLVRLKYLTGVNRWTNLGADTVQSLWAATGGDRSESLLWREMLSTYDIGDVASAVFSDQFGCWGFLDLWRSERADRFTPAEIAFLVGIAEPVTAALRRSQADTFVAQPARAPAPPGPVVLLLSPALTVQIQTQATLRHLELLVPPAEGQVPVPASAYNVAAQLLAVESGVDQNPASARAHLGNGLWVTLRAGRIGDAARSEDRDIAVTIEVSSPPERVDLFARAFGLSTRETELLGHLVSGRDTREIAGRMFLSGHTVQDHLKSVFGKTSEHSRRVLLSRVLGS